MAHSNDLAATLDRLAAGDVRTLSRAISMVEDGAEGSAALLAGCRARGGNARRIGITGPPGAGKSTLVDQMIRQLRAAGETVGVIAVDPSSPLSGGALLGDRIRMQGFAGDDGVYIRSMASRGALGGLARTAAAVAEVMQAAGRSTILIETVGVGQDEVEIARLADVTVLVLVPGMGDDVQSLKAGVMEIADIFAINKSDLPGADRVEAELKAMQSLAHAERVAPIVRTVAATGEGVGALLEAVEGWLAGLERRQERNTGVLRFAQDDEGLGAVRIDHLGVAVRSIAAARVFYEALGLAVSHEETVEHEQVHTAMLPLGASRIELLEPVAEDSTIGRFLAKRGEGLHHLAIRVDRLDERFAAMQAAGHRLASERIQTGAGGHRYFFVHPAATGGVLLELVGE